MNQEDSRFRLALMCSFTELSVGDDEQSEGILGLRGVC